LQRHVGVVVEAGLHTVGAGGIIGDALIPGFAEPSDFSAVERVANFASAGVGVGELPIDYVYVIG
jgi:hypothetical protein